MIVNRLNTMARAGGICWISRHPWRCLALAVTAVWIIAFLQEMTGLGRWRTIPMGEDKVFPSRENRWLWKLPRHYATHLTELTGYITEDGRPLARVTSHREVRDHGAGRFRLHGRLVSFAAWDDSNPNTNGRRYRFHAPKPLNPWIVWGGFGLVLAAHGWAQRADPPSTMMGHEITRPSTAHRSWLRGFWMLTVAAVAVRAALVLVQPEYNDGFMMARGMPYSDAAGWLEMSRLMAGGHGLSGPWDGQRPLYPLMLAPWLAARLPDVTAAQWINVVLGASAAAVFGGLVARLAGWTAGVAAASFLAVGGMAPRFLLLPMSEVTGVALLVSALGFLWHGAASGHPRPLLLGGAFFAMSNLACPFTLLGLPFAGLVAAACAPSWSAFLRRGLWVAIGASLVLVPWLARQKLAHGIATISINGPLMLYATASPTGKYDTTLASAIEHLGSTASPTHQAHEYARLFREAVRQDPGRYLERVGRGFTSWWIKFDPRQPSVLILLIGAGVTMALGRWWQAGQPGALLAAALVPPIVLATSRLDGGLWITLAGAGAVATSNRRCWSLVGLIGSVLLGSALMNALTSGALANRLWVTADWLAVALALIALHHGVRALDRSPFIPWSPALHDPAPAATDVPGLHPTAAAQALWILASIALVAAMAVRGPLPQPTFPTPSPDVIDSLLAATITQHRTRQPVDPNTPDLWVQPVYLSHHRAFIPARLAIGHWSRAFSPRHEARTVVRATTQTHRSITLQIPGDARTLPPGPWVAVGTLNHVPHPPLGAETTMIEVLTLWPIDAAGRSLPAPR